MKHTHMLIAAALIGAIACAFYKNARESFRGRGHRQYNNKDKHNLMFRGSYPSAPVVCLAGSSKIPCTEFSGA
jgi:hypothetical protein